MGHIRYLNPRKNCNTQNLRWWNYTKDSTNGELETMLVETRASGNHFMRGLGVNSGKLIPKIQYAKYVVQSLPILICTL